MQDDNCDGLNDGFEMVDCSERIAVRKLTCKLGVDIAEGEELRTALLPGAPFQAGVHQWSRCSFWFNKRRECASVLEAVPQ